MARRPLVEGDRVRLSEDGREQNRGLAFNNIRGIYLGPSKRYGFIRVKTDTRKDARTFRARDWELDEPPASSRPPSAGPMGGPGAGGSS